MKTVQSADGTQITYDQFGEGEPPLATVVGAFNTRSTTEGLARVLQERVTVLNYDRRGRGDSGDTLPYTVDREIEDLDAVIAAAGGNAAVFGYSSGALLALKAAAAGSSISRLILYEPTYRPSEAPPVIPPDLADQLENMLAEGRRGDAVELFQTQAVKIPPEVVAQMRHAPFRPFLEALAHTLVYEARLIGDLSLPSALVQAVTVPTLVIVGEQKPPFMGAAARALAAALPNGRLSILPGQGHDINPAATAPVVLEFLGAANSVA